MRVLVGYGSTHGSTQGVAARIATRLSTRGCQVELRPLDQAADGDPLTGYDAVVLGSAIHNGSWLPSASGYLLRNIRWLAGQPVWLFSVATIGDRDSMLAPVVARCFRSFGRQPKELADFQHAIHPRDHHAFTGAIAPEHYLWFGRLIFRSMGGRFGDHRNWPEIDAWADGIADELVARGSAPLR